MRYIDLQEVVRHVPDAWKQRADQARRDVQNYPENQKPAAVNARADVWQDPDLKARMLEVSYDKCWYCESRQVRSDKNVDHFRPKNRVAECPEHPGYWWLAFNLDNYRLSCTYCNSRRKDRENKTTGGKHDHFPLVDEAQRVYAGDVDREQPELLDPLTHTDPGLLWFLPDGTAIPKYNSESYPIYHLRAQRSIDLYHLNHTDLQEKRKQLCNFIKRRVEEGEIYCVRGANGDDTAQRAWEGVLTDLYEITNSTAEYSATARAIVAELSRDHPWAESVIHTG